MISFIRSALSGTMLIRARRLNFVGWITSAVPAQLLPTYSTEADFGRWRLRLASATGARGRAAASAAASSATIRGPLMCAILALSGARRAVLERELVGHVGERGRGRVALGYDQLP